MYVTIAVQKKKKKGYEFGSEKGGVDIGGAGEREGKGRTKLCFN